MSDESAALTVTAETFMTDVVEASADLPVLVDFWAPWCAPCRQLMPILERLAQEYAGRFRLAKVNTDEQPALAHQLGIRSLPTVVLFKERAAVDHFMGLVPEAQIRLLLDKHVGPAAPSPLDRARELKTAGDYAGARAMLEQARAQSPDDLPIQAELAELLVREGDLDGARDELQRLRGIDPSHASVKRLAAIIEFSAVLAAHPDARAVRERLAAQSDDLELRHALAVHQLLSGEAEPALAAWLDMLRHHRNYQDDLARRSLVLAFELLGDADPLVPRTRRAMANLLF